MRPWRFTHPRRRAASGRSRSLATPRSLATSVFFVTRSLLIDNGPDRAIIHRKALVRQFSGKTAQSKHPPPPRPNRLSMITAGALRQPDDDRQAPDLGREVRASRREVIIDAPIQ